MSPEERYNRLLRFLSGEDERPDWMHRQSGWAQSGPLYTTQGTSGVGNQAVKCMVERFDRAAVFTVQIGLNVGDGGFPVQTLAEVIWSINGTPIRRLVSVSQGTSITGVTESARIAVYDDTPTVEEDQAVVEYIALINVAPGPRAATTLPPFLRAWRTTQQLLASGSTTLTVPRNAGVVGFRLSVFASGNAGAEVTMTDSSGTVYDQYDVPPGQNSTFIPIAPGTDRLLISNNDTANPINLSGQWAIDG
jgi:hypothetical protein